jgi:hypothetical protein
MDGGNSWNNFGSPKTIDSKGKAVSDAYTPQKSGTYYFRAVYSGDTNFNGSQSSDKAEKLTVKKTSTTVKIKLSSHNIRLNESVKAKITINASAKGVMPAASGDWVVQASKDSRFKKGVVEVDSGTLSETLPCTITTQSFTHSSKGSWYFRVVYSGDDNYSNCQSKGKSVKLKVR